jgi:hypothetical protein
MKLSPHGLVPVLPHYMWCACIIVTPNDELLFPSVAVVDDAPHFLGSGSSESYGRYAEATLSSSQPLPYVYVILTIVASLEQNSSKGKALI